MTTNTAEVIDLNEASPAWHYTSPMAFARRHLNLTVLPTGEVLATGGVGGTTFDDVTKGVHAAEMWNPQTGQWTTLASNADYPRISWHLAPASRWPSAQCGQRGRGRSAG